METINTTVNEKLHEQHLNNTQEGSTFELIKTGSQELPKRLSVYIPDNLELESLIEQHPPNIFRFHIDKLAYIISLIYAIPLRLKDYDFEAENGYIPLNSTLLRRRVREYDEYLNYLIETGIFEKREGYKYLAGGKSSGYRFTQNYNVNPKRRYITWPRLIKAIVTINKSEEETFIDITERPLDYLNKWWNENLQFDYNGAKRWLNNQYRKELAENRLHCDRRYYVRKIVVEKMRNREYMLHQDSTSGRVHNLFTQLKSELRQFITYDNKKLVAVDITNSQPYLALALLKKEAFYSNNISNTISLYNSLSTSSSSIMLSLCSENLEESPDLIEFIDLVTSGEFYEMFGQLLLNRGLIDEEKPKELRKIAKRTMFASMFGHNNEKMKIIDTETGREKFVTNDGMITFKEAFPTVYKIFREIKKGEHRTLACVLQNLEAELVLHKACKIISEEASDVPLFTLHDAIVTTENNANYVKRVLSEVLLDAIGIAPVIKLEPWEEKMEAA